MLDPRRLLVLRAVVRAGSMTAAAPELGYTPSAVSQQVAALERALAGLTATWLLDDVVNVALPAGHPALEDAGLTSTDEIDVSTLRDAAWIRDSGNVCREQLVEMCAAAGFTPNIAFDSDDFPMVSGLVESGVGVALVPDLGSTRWAAAWRCVGYGLEWCVGSRR